MFSKVALFVASTLAVVAIAAPSGNGGISDSCNTGSIQCCNSVQSHNDFSRSFAKTLLGASDGDLTSQYGSTCSPITAVGTGSGSSCNSQPVCCSGNSFNGLIVLGCSPININL